MSSISSPGGARTTHALNLPRGIEVPGQARDIAPETLRQRTALLEFLFYDLGVLSAAEAKVLATTCAAEGAILCVGPSSAPTIRVWPDHARFALEGPKDVTAVAVAGVGSSALGAAAFARNVADAIDRPVLVVVSGHGLSDLMSEALEGPVLTDQTDPLRHLLAPLDGFPRGEADRTYDDPGPGARESLDVRTLKALLTSGQRFDLVVGHSRGNLVISEALFDIGQSSPELIEILSETARLISIGARIALPRSFPVVTDIIGALDRFAALDSRPGIPADLRVPMAWHHTNTELPLHLPVTRALLEVLERLH